MNLVLLSVLRLALLRLGSVLTGHTGTLAASRALHSNCLLLLFRSKWLPLGYLIFTWHEDKFFKYTMSNPVPHALTRLTTDIFEVDNVLPYTLTGLFNLILELLIVFGVYLYMLMRTSAPVVQILGLVVLLPMGIALPYIQAGLETTLSVNWLSLDCVTEFGSFRYACLHVITLIHFICLRAFSGLS